MIDVFFCTIEDSDELRQSMAETCEARWQMVDGVRVMGICDTMLGVSPVGFQRSRRIFADEEASGDFYIVADDDLLLPADFNLSECLRIFRAHQNYAVISLMPSNCTFSEWTPEDYIVESTPDVMEVASVGGIRFCRKGHMKEWPPMEPNFPGYDKIQASQIRKQGQRCGYFRAHKAAHLGEGFSTVWNAQMVAK
jgi:hypothetical protein